MSGSVVSDGYSSSNNNNSSLAGPAAVPGGEGGGIATAASAAAPASASATTAAAAVTATTSLEARIQADLDDAMSNVLVHSVSIASQEVTLYILEDDTDDSNSEEQQQQQYLLPRRNPQDEGGDDGGEQDYESPTRRHSTSSVSSSRRLPHHDACTPPASNRRIAKPNSGSRTRSPSPLPGPSSAVEAAGVRRRNSERHARDKPQDEPHLRRSSSTNSKLRSRSSSSSSSARAAQKPSSSDRSPSASSRQRSSAGDATKERHHRKRSPDSPSAARGDGTESGRERSASRSKSRGASSSSRTKMDGEDRHRNRDRDRSTESENRGECKPKARGDSNRRSRSTSVQKRHAAISRDEEDGGGDMDASMRKSTRRTRSRTPRTATSGESPAHAAGGSSIWSSRHHPHHSSSGGKSSRSPSPSRGNSTGRSAGHRHHDASHKERPNRSRSASCHRRHEENDNDRERRSRSTSRPSRLPQYSSQQRQRRLSATGSATTSPSSPAARGSDPAAFVLSCRSPASSPKTGTAAADLVSPTALRDAIVERTQLVALREAAALAVGQAGGLPLAGSAASPPATPRRKAPRSAAAPSGARGSDPPGHYLGSLNSSIRGSLLEAITRVNSKPTDRAALSAPSAPSLASPGNPPASAAAAARAKMSAAPASPNALSPSSLLKQHDSTSTSASLQLDIEDPVQVSTLVSPRTVMTMETKDSRAHTNARLQSNHGSRQAGRDDSGDNDDSDDKSQGDGDDDGNYNHGDDMSIFSELWGSSTKVAAKVEEDRAVEEATNPNLECALNSPDKKSSANPTKTSRRVPDRAVSQGSSKSMMKSLSDLLEANMGGLLDSPDRDKRRASKRVGNSPGRSNNNAKSSFHNCDDDEDTCSLLLEDENANKASNGLIGGKGKRVHDEDDATSVMTPFMQPEMSGFGQFGKIKDAGKSLFKSPSQWLKHPSATQTRSSKPPLPQPPKAQAEQAPARNPAKPATNPPMLRGESPETSETMVTSFGSSSSDRTNNVAALKPGVNARSKVPVAKKKTLLTVKPGNSDDGIEENLAAFSSILDANSELTKTDTPGFSKFVESASSSKTTPPHNSNDRSGPRLPKVSTGGFGRPSLGSLSNPLNVVLTSAKRVFRPRRGLSAAAERSSSFRESPNPKRRSVVGNCYDMRGFDDE